MFEINDAVRWVSSNAKKEGVIVGVVSAGRLPRDAGFLKLGDTSLPRDHESYVVRGGVPGSRTALYWPVVSLLRAAEGLTLGEIEWCNKNALRIRSLMSWWPEV